MSESSSVGVEYPSHHVAARSAASPWWMDAVDLACCLALGQRYAILGPARSGRTTILMELGKSVADAVDDLETFVVLCEQPVEERMEWRVALPSATLLSADADDGIDGIAALADDLTRSINESNARHRLLLLDSMSNLMHAVNAHGPNDPRVLTGGITQIALERIRSLHALGRAFTDGGSVTVVCTSMVGGELEADDLLARELTGTGNAELVMHPTLARAEVFPPIDLERSGARGEERIVGDEEAQRRAGLRTRCLESGELAATELLLDGLMEQAGLANLLDHLAAD